MPNESRSPEPSRNIQIWPLVTVSAKRCWAARDDLLRLGIIPLCLIFVVTLPAQNLMIEIFQSGKGGPPAMDQAMAAAMPRLLLLALCSTAATCLFAVNWVRLLTLGATAAPSLGLSIGGRHLRFFLFMIAIGLTATILMTALALLLQGFGGAGLLTAFSLGMISWLGIIVRLSPRWIGIAIDAPMQLSVAWRRTRGQGFKLFLALLLIEISALVAEQILASIFQFTGLIGMAPLAFAFLFCAIELIRIALQLGALLAAYPQFVRETV